MILKTQCSLSWKTRIGLSTPSQWKQELDVSDHAPVEKTGAPSRHEAELKGRLPHRMRILLLNQIFYPDSAATSQFLTDLARHLDSEGHSVRVICGRSPYAEPDS